MIPMMPHRFITSTNLDMERINDNLEAGARDVNRNLDQRYTYSTISFPLDGITNASATVLRQLAIRRPGTNNAVEITGVEVCIYAAGSVEWTLACSDTTWPSITVTAAGATTEAMVISGVPVGIPSSSADVTFTMSADSSSTITAGRITLYLRCDRGNQGTAHTTYLPTLIDSASSTAGSLLDTQLTALATSVSVDTANDKDIRATLFAVRGLASGSTVAMHLPSGLERIMGLRAYLVAVVAGTATFSEATSSNTVTALAGTGATARATGSSSTIYSFTDDPMTPGSDAVISITAAGGQTSLLAYMILWWS